MNASVAVAKATDVCKAPLIPPVVVVGVQLFGGFWIEPACDPQFYSGCDTATNRCVLNADLARMQSAALSAVACGGSCPAGLSCTLVNSTRCSCAPPVSAVAVTAPVKAIRYWYD